MERSAGAVLFRNRDGRREYLLLKYAYRITFWSFAKGNIEEGESEREAAVREIIEETALEEFELLDDFYEKTNYYLMRSGKRLYKEVAWFLGEVRSEKDGEVSEEHEELIWTSYDKALEMMKFENDKRILREAQAFLAVRNI